MQIAAWSAFGRKNVLAVFGKPVIIAYRIVNRWELYKNGEMGYESENLLG